MAKIKYCYIPTKYNKWWMQKDKDGVLKVLSVLQKVKNLLHR